jgi:hypothetical protein
VPGGGGGGGEGGEADPDAPVLYWRPGRELLVLLRSAEDFHYIDRSTSRLVA